jgi:hypothetical protein
MQNVLSDCVNGSTVLTWLCSRTTLERTDDAVAYCAARMVLGGAVGGGLGAGTALANCVATQVGGWFGCELAMAPCRYKASTAYNDCWAKCSVMGPIGLEIP